jgi:hypothetical protein
MPSHAIDIFIGADHQAKSPGQPSFMSRRMQTYMPHRLFLNHLKTNPRPLRTFVMDRNDEALMMAFNLAVIALKEFRDAHIIIAALYILGPARRAAAAKRKLLLEVAAEAGDIHPISSVHRRRGLSAQPPKGTDWRYGFGQNFEGHSGPDELEGSCYTGRLKLVFTYYVPSFFIFGLYSSILSVYTRLVYTV